jgi:hypothetical protein
LACGTTTATPPTGADRQRCLRLQEELVSARRSSAGERRTSQQIEALGGLFQAIGVGFHAFGVGSKFVGGLFGLDEGGLDALQEGG